MTVLGNAVAIRAGSVAINKAYLGAALAWQSGGGVVTPTPALVKQTQGTNGTSAAWSFAATSTAGNGLLALFASSAGSTGDVSTLTDTAGNTWTKAFNGGTGGQANTGITGWYCSNASSPGTISVATSSHSWQWQVLEFSGIASTGQPDHIPVVVPNSTAATSLASATALTTVDKSLIVAVVGYSGTSTSTLTSSGWTALTNPPASGSKNLRSAWRVGTPPGSYQATWSLDVAATYTGAIVSLKAGGSSGAFAFSPNATISPTTQIGPTL